MQDLFRNSLGVVKEMLRILKGTFPYYLIYDFGKDNPKAVRSYTITSAAASLYDVDVTK